jgi:hypothetical protein
VRSKDKPSLDVCQVYSDVAPTVRGKAKRSRLESGIDDVVGYESLYEGQHDAVSLFCFPDCDHAGLAKAADLIGLYETMRDGVQGRPYYHELFASVPRCLLCDRADVEHLDHYLPKADYPALAVTPVNLVPTCSGCNELRNHKPPKGPSGMTLHPYCDNIESERWLWARIDEAEPAVVYFVDPPAHWPDLLKQRTYNHFAVLELADAYAKDAANEVADIAHDLQKLHELGGPTRVAEHLKDAKESRKSRRLNSWTTAFYDAAWQNLWFCDGGFHAIVSW